MPVTAFAAERTIDFGKFLEEVAAAGYNYDGQGVTVRWSPTSACTDSAHENDRARCLFPEGEDRPAATGNTPQRVQEPNAQYQIFEGQTNVSISNVNFIYVPADYTLCANSGWKGTTTAEKTRNAELQMLNTGDVTFTECTFDKVIVSPFSSTTESTFTQCKFANVYDAYAIKDIHSANTEITGCTFTTCGGAIYLEGSTAKEKISITGNTFTDIDTYAAQGKAGTRGLIQFSKNGDYSNADIEISGNSSTGTAAVLRQLNDTVTAAVVDVEALKADNQFDADAAMLVGETTITANKTVYVNADTGNDSTGEGTSSAPVKTFAKALTLANAGDTIEIIGDLKHSIQSITKPLTIQGSGETRVAVSGGVGLPMANGTVTFRNLSFNGTSTFGSYSQGSEYSKLDLVIDDCAFTKAGGNCVYIIPEINSLTVTNCDFTSDVTSYQKQYMIWPYAAKTITITDNTFNGQGLTRAPIHLGEGHPEGTTAIVSNNTISGFERGVQMALINDVENTVTISGNTFEDVALSADTKSDINEVGTVFIHETQKDNTRISYTDNKLTGTTAQAVYTENSMDTAQLFASFTDNTKGEDAEAVALGALEDNVFDAFVAQIGQNKYKSFDAAMEAAKGMTGDVTITLIADVDYSDVCSSANNASNTISFDLSSASGLSGLTIQGASKEIKIITGVDGNGIDGGTEAEPRPYCPKISVKLPEGASLTVENLTFPKDLQFDSDDGTVVVQNCVFNGSISGYPQAKSISYLNNTFEFKGTAANFYSGNAYPVWYKVTGGNELDLIFTGNTVIGCRGVHVECRGGQADIQVDNNHFELSDSSYPKKTVALQLVNHLNGDISFQNNYVDAYMAICFYNGLVVDDGAALTVKNNYLVGDCKLYGSNEWGFSEEDADAFAQSIINALTGDGSTSTVTPGHTEHSYENGVCTICGQSQPSSGGGSSVTYYSSTVEQVENGTVTVSPKSASKGTTVTISVTADEGYVLDTLTVTDKDGKTVTLTDKGSGKYTFTMPASKVTVKALFKAEPQEALPFTDVAEGAWYYEAVAYAYEKGIMTGTNDGTTFSPAQNLTRGMMARILYNLEGSPDMSDENLGYPFADVSGDAWYADGVYWARQNGIVDGYGNNTFGPEDPITREQMAAILYNYAKFKGEDMTATTDLTSFADDEKVSDWAVYAMKWAVAEKLIQGSNNSLDPLGTATRAEVAQLFMNLLKR